MSRGFVFFDLEASKSKADMIFGFLNKNFAWFSCPADKVDSFVKFIGVPTDD